MLFKVDKLTESMIWQRVLYLCFGRGNKPIDLTFMSVLIIKDWKQKGQFYLSR